MPSVTSGFLQHISLTLDELWTDVNFFPKRLVWTSYDLTFISRSRSIPMNENIMETFIYFRSLKISVFHIPITNMKDKWEIFFATSWFCLYLAKLKIMNIQFFPFNSYDVPCFAALISLNAWLTGAKSLSFELCTFSLWNMWNKTKSNCFDSYLTVVKRARPCHTLFCQI